MATKTRKSKSLPICSGCGSNEALYVTFANGERLPSYVMAIGVGIFCPPCNDKRKNK